MGGKAAILLSVVGCGRSGLCLAMGRRRMVNLGGGGRQRRGGRTVPPPADFPACVSQDRQIFPDHTVEDNLVIGQKKGAQGQDEWSIRRVYDVFPPLRYRIAGRLSDGEQQMLAFARTLMGNPALYCWTSPARAWRRSSCSASASCCGSCAAPVRPC
jgi:ABC-type nitrate/sulfonate/bicarbonate transport system ATPase subunit